MIKPILDRKAISYENAKGWGIEQKVFEVWKKETHAINIESRFIWDEWQNKHIDLIISGKEWEKITNQWPYINDD